MQHMRPRRHASPGGYGVGAKVALTGSVVRDGTDDVAATAAGKKQDSFVNSEHN